MLAQVGLPRGRPKNPDGTLATRFSRTSGAATLVVRSGEIGGTELSLPYGSRPRLMLADICTYAVKNRTREVDLRESVREYLIERLDVSGVSGGKKGTYTHFKNQAQALAACRMQLEASYGARYINYKGEPIKSFEAWSTTGLGGQQGLWPGKLLLDYDFYQTLIGRGMPLDFKAYRSLMRSPLAMDAYTWLTHRMWRIDGSVDVRWDKLHKDMGQEYGQLKDFKRAFSRALKQRKPCIRIRLTGSIPSGTESDSAKPIHLCRSLVRCCEIARNTGQTVCSKCRQSYAVTVAGHFYIPVIGTGRPLKSP